ncbi:ABC transporter substrate-binding protein [Leptospira barantonii]|uniref:ABC transporter substrate-binding protein n=1 Tax=Leptospira barantonii TaxID=2023184 RepID=A0A5F2B5U2_9LEPT|nr:extracellular solute-binding protein [Leptospira barantonii]TGM01054.1 ABC transporter substrate-binding protein [Leptospira barantonii]
MKKILYSVFCILFVLSCFLVSNCGDKEEPETSVVVETLPWNGSPDSIPVALRGHNPIASLEAKKGGTFRIYSHQFPKSLNYYLDQFSTTAHIFGLMFEPLLDYHPLTLEPIPHLASSWRISPDKKKFVFTIDSNAVWSDGKPITAHDVLFTYETLMDKNNNTAVFRIDLSRFEKPVVLSEREIEFTQKEIHWSNFNTIANSLYILPAHYYQGRNFDKENFDFPVVSGPYSMLSAKKGRYVKMRRRGDYWMRAYPFYKGVDNFDTILFKVYNEEPIAFQAFKKGDIDIYPTYTASFWVKDAVGEKFEENYILKQKIYNSKPIGFQGLVFNMRREIFSDVKVRKAFAHLVDRKLLIEKLAYNEYEETNAFYQDLWNGSSPNPPIDFDVKKARELLAQAGWKTNSKGILEKDGKEFRFSILERDKKSEKYLTLIQERAKEVGIIINLEATDLAEWSSRMDKYDFDMTWAAWGGGIFKDPEAMWYSKYAEEKGQPNLSGFKNVEVDKLVEQQRTEFNVPKRNEILRKIDKILTAEVPYVLLWNTSATRIMYWNRFKSPKNPLGKYGSEKEASSLWWLDEAQSSKLNETILKKEKLPSVPEKVYFQ